MVIHHVLWCEVRTGPEIQVLYSCYTYHVYYKIYPYFHLYNLILELAMYTLLVEVQHSSIGLAEKSLYILLCRLMFTCHVMYTCISRRYAKFYTQTPCLSLSNHENSYLMRQQMIQLLAWSTCRTFYHFYAPILVYFA